MLGPSRLVGRGVGLYAFSRGRALAAFLALGVLLVGSCSDDSGGDAQEDGTTAGQGGQGGEASPDECRTDRDCAGVLRCDAERGGCVECLTDADCATNELCVEHACVPETGGEGGAAGAASGGNAGTNDGGAGARGGGAGATGDGGSGNDSGTGGSAGSSGGGGTGGATGGGAGAGGSGGTGGTGGTSGSAGNPSGGSAGTGPRCNVSTPFGTPSPVGGLSMSTIVEGGARLTPDERMVVFHSDRDGSDMDLYIATRQNRTDAFGPPTAIGLDDGTSEMRPWISEDGRAVVFDRVPTPPTASPLADSFYATRADLGSPFGTAMPLVDGGAPFVVGGANGTLYYSPGTASIAQVPLVDWVPTGTPVIVVNPAYRPVPAPDELVMYVSNNTTTLVTERSLRTEVFPTPTEIGVDARFPTWISPDLCRLYLDVFDGQTSDVYVAERAP